MTIVYLRQVCRHRQIKTRMVVTLIQLLVYTWDSFIKTKTNPPWFGQVCSFPVIYMYFNTSIRPVERINLFSPKKHYKLDFSSQIHSWTLYGACIRSCSIHNDFFFYFSFSPCGCIYILIILIFGWRTHSLKEKHD